MRRCSASASLEMGKSTISLDCFIRLLPAFSRVQDFALRGLVGSRLLRGAGGRVHGLVNGFRRAQAGYRSDDAVTCNRAQEDGLPVEHAALNACDGGIRARSAESNSALETPNSSTTHSGRRPHTARSGPALGVLARDWRRACPEQVVRHARDAHAAERPATPDPLAAFVRACRSPGRASTRQQLKMRWRSKPSLHRTR